MNARCMCWRLITLGFLLAVGSLPRAADAEEQVERWFLVVVPKEKLETFRRTLKPTGATLDERPRPPEDALAVLDAASAPMADPGSRGIVARYVKAGAGWLHLFVHAETPAALRGLDEALQKPSPVPFTSRDARGPSLRMVDGTLTGFMRYSVKRNGLLALPKVAFEGSVDEVVRAALRAERVNPREIKDISGDWPAPAGLEFEGVKLETGFIPLEQFRRLLHRIVEESPALTVCTADWWAEGASPMPGHARKVQYPAARIGWRRQAKGSNAGWQVDVFVGAPKGKAEGVLAAIHAHGLDALEVRTKQARRAVDTSTPHVTPLPDAAALWAAAREVHGRKAFAEVTMESFLADVAQLVVRATAKDEETLRGMVAALLDHASVKARGGSVMLQRFQAVRDAHQVTLRIRFDRAKPGREGVAPYQGDLKRLLTAVAGAVGLKDLHVGDQRDDPSSASGYVTWSRSVGIDSIEPTVLAEFMRRLSAEAPELAVFDLRVSAIGTDPAAPENRLRATLDVGWREQLRR